MLDFSDHMRTGMSILTSEAAHQNVQIFITNFIIFFRTNHLVRLEDLVENQNIETIPSSISTCEVGIQTTREMGTQTCDLVPHSQVDDVPMFFSSQHGCDLSTYCCLPPRRQEKSTSTDKIPFISKKCDQGNNTDVVRESSALGDLSCDEDYKAVTGCSKDVFNLLHEKISTSVRDGMKLLVTEKLLLALIKLKHNLPLAFLSRIFGVNIKTVSKHYGEVVDALFECSNFDWWLPRSTIQQTMPEDFKKNYPNCTVIIDGSEVRCEVSSNVKAQVNTYSNYKSSYTVKYLIGIAPSGYIMFLSNFYGGRVTDSHLTSNCGILEKLQQGDEVMADKGFPSIEEHLTRKGCFLVMPPFHRGKTQFSEGENNETYKIASHRIHVERAIRRMKYFQILHFLDRFSLTKGDKILRVIGYICNHMPDLIKEI